MANKTVTGPRHVTKMKIRKGDMVVVLSGDDKGKKARVIEVLPKELKALVEGVNIISRHSKPDAKNTQGGIIKKEALVHISKLALAEARTTKAAPRKSEKNKSAV